MRDESSIDIARSVDPLCNILYYQNTPNDNMCAFVESRGNMTVHVDHTLSLGFDFSKYNVTLTGLNQTNSPDIQDASNQGFKAMGYNYGARGF